MTYHICRIALAIGAAASCYLASEAAQAATTSTTFAVTSTVQATCVVSATSLAFGAYTGAQANATASVTVSCTTTTAYNVGLSSGTASGATVTARKMSGPSSSLLSYSLFRDAARTQIWGETVGTETVTGTGNGTAQVLNVYGTVPAGQLSTPGSYSDTIVVTVTY